MPGWSYEMFSSNNFDEFNRKLQRAINSITRDGLVPSVSYSHSVTPSGTSYSAIVLGVAPNSAAPAPPQE